MSLMTENMITPTSGWRSRMIRSASSPPMPGICTSSSTRSMAVVRSFARPSSPDEAMTAFIPPFSMMKWALWRMVASSSTMRMVGIANQVQTQPLTRLRRARLPRLYHPDDSHQEKERYYTCPHQRLGHRRLEAPEEVDARQPARQVDEAMQSLPVAEPEALLPALRGGDGERQEKHPGRHAHCNEGPLDDVLADLAEVEPLIEARVREQVQAGVEEAEVAEQLSDPDGPVDLEENLRGRAGEGEHEENEGVETQPIEHFGNGVRAQIIAEEAPSQPGERQKASRERRRDEPLLFQKNFLRSMPA